MDDDEKPVFKQMSDGRMYFECPGCDRPHAIHVDGPHKWEWNRDLIKPTVSPSILCTRHGIDYRCHCYVRDGKIQFLNDCTHDLKGTTVDLPAWSGRWDEA